MIDMCVCVCVCVLCPETMYLSANSFNEAVKKEQTKTKELEDKYNEKIVKHSVNCFSFLFPLLKYKS